jgi:ethanolamine utilization microcompartment shell protein EutL
VSTITTTTATSVMAMEIISTISTQLLLTLQLPHHHLLKGKQISCS